MTANIRATTLIKKAPNRGMNLVEVCIGIALLGIATAAVFSMMRTATATLASDRARSNAQTLRRLILEKVSCGNTLNPTGASVLTVPPSGCTALQLKDSANNTIFPSGATVEDFEVTYSCWSSTGGVNPDQIRVMYRSLNPTLSKTYGTARDLFVDVKPLCYSYFQGASIPQTSATIPVYLNCAARPIPVLSPPAAPCSTTPIGYLSPP